MKGLICFGWCLNCLDCLIVPYRFHGPMGTCMGPGPRADGWGRAAGASVAAGVGRCAGRAWRAWQAPMFWGNRSAGSEEWFSVGKSKDPPGKAGWNVKAV
jgi:hypothetical protein